MMRPAAVMAALLASGSAYTYNGDATYYGGAGEGGACSQKFKPPGYKTVAMNHLQFNEGWACGTCIQGCIFKPNNVQECFTAIVDNECPECANQAVDMGWSGDGRYKVGWNIIPCPPAEPKLWTVGSNPWYIKLKIELVGPVKSVRINGVAATHTADNFWVVYDSVGMLACGPTVTFTLASGATLTRCMPAAAIGGTCPSGGKACSGTATATTKPTSPPASTTGVAGARCENGLLNSGGRACCPKACGRCGGDGCAALSGGAHDCCAGDVLKYSPRGCKNNAAPCTVYASG
ncbi:hypothetical protein JKP88DRAFT_259401 [Tribonema minus]|uniref:Expansin-like EG45 domain-containing protein n=1 Tax=Tribonema minus TaxID=303371 RepID=A0A835ZHM1_9STRA|nr:hypothetical protein JKP88DRAFT_259401 [Tribonema minus]